MTNYLTDEEMEMDAEKVNLQIVLGLKTCHKVEDVIGLLEDIRAHERKIRYEEIKQYLENWIGSV